MEERYCSNCRAELPEGEEFCPACGEYAGDVFDGRMPGRRSRIRPLLVLLVIVTIAASAAWWFTRSGEISLSWPLRGKQTETPAADLPPIRVVGDRPGGATKPRGAAINEPEAILRFRRHLTSTTGVTNECLAVMSNGYANGSYRLTAYNHCDAVRLGRWRVNAKTGEITR